MFEYPPKTILFSAPKSELSEKEAKEYIKANGYSFETVKLMRIGEQICVIRK